MSDLEVFKSHAKLLGFTQTYWAILGSLLEDGMSFEDAQDIAWSGAKNYMSLFDEQINKDEQK